MELNFLNEKLNVDVNKQHKVSEQMFWLYYCQMLNIRNPSLSEKDCVLLSHLLTYPVDSNIGDINIMKEICSKVTVALPNLYGKYKQLVEKGFIIKNEDGYFFHPFLLSFQRYVKHMLLTKQECNIKFSIPFNIQP